MKNLRRLVFALLALTLFAAACGDDGGDSASHTLTIGAIPDQDPDLLARNYDLLTDFLSDRLGVSVEYSPVAEYDSAVTQFKTGDLDLVWFGGLTGVQARLQVPGAEAVAQRDIDAKFHSVFIARVDSGIEPFSSVDGLTSLADHSFTFGSESSTSGRLMPQSFMDQSGLSLDELSGDPGFSGSHDKTIQLVVAGTYDAGALNEQVWDTRLAAGEVDLTQVREVFRTPPYFDYHWVAQPALDARFGDGFQARLIAAFESLDSSDPDQATILEFFSAGAFIGTDNSNYDQIESVARDSGLIG